MDPTIEDRLTRLEIMFEKNQKLSANILDSIKRLERIALAHTISLDDIDNKLLELENRRKPKAN
jgi:hypothetical protein